MTSAIISQLGVSLEAALGSAVFSMPVTVQRSYQPLVELKNLDGVLVTIVPKAIERQRASRAAVQHEYQLDVAVQKKVGAGSDLAELDELMALVEEIADYLTGLDLAECAARFINLGNSVIFAPDHLREKGVFTSLLTVTYRAMR